jgi:hypothetical protein
MKEKKQKRKTKQKTGCAEEKKLNGLGPLIAIRPES